MEGQEFTERSGLIMSMSELSAQNDRLEQQQRRSSQYASRDQAFYDQGLVQFVGDEVHSLLQFICCEFRPLANFYNPLYVLFFLLLYALTYPGAALHWALLPCIPVKYKEYPEEREMRARGVYSAIGISLLCIPLALAGVFLGDGSMAVINELSIFVNVCIVLSCLLALKAMADELVISTRVFIIGIWVIDCILMVLVLFDVYSYLTLSWYSLLEYIVRLLQILVYTVIGIQSTQFWSMYVWAEQPRRIWQRDTQIAVILGVLMGSVIMGFIVVSAVSEDRAWRLMYWYW